MIIEGYIIVVPLNAEDGDGGRVYSAGLLTYMEAMKMLERLHAGASMLDAVVMCVSRA